MNERIRELALQAGIHFHKGGTLDAGPNGIAKFVLYSDMEKFAELIVRECISTIENAENGYQDYRNQIEDGMRNHCISLIKNEFGVEE